MTKKPTVATRTKITGSPSTPASPKTDETLTDETAAAGVSTKSTSPDNCPKGKLGVMVDLLRRPQGARIAELSQATGWLTHSVRGAMSGALKARGYAITSVKDEVGRVYRIAAAAEAQA